MEILEKIGEKATETCRTVAEKTNKIASDTKLKMKINDNKSKIKEIYTEIGKKVYQKYVLDGNLDIKSDIQKELKRIDELSEEIKEFERQRLELADIKECIECKNKIDKSAKFCQECGAKQPEEVKEEALEVEIIEEADSSEEKAEEIATDIEENISGIVEEENKTEEN